MEVTTPTTHRSCPVDGQPCWRERAEGCPHMKKDVWLCSFHLWAKMTENKHDLWAALARR